MPTLPSTGETSTKSGIPTVFDRRLLAWRRQRAAGAIGGVDFLLQRVADDISARLDAVTRRFARVLDLGAHHGPVTRAIAGRAGVEIVIEADLSPAMLSGRPGPRVACDEEALPFADASLDLIVSGLVLHHVNDLPGALAQIRRALRPDGLFLGAMLGGATLGELRAAFLAAEAEIHGGVSPRVAPFADVRELGGLLQRAGFALSVADADTVTATYATPLDLMREIKAMGASNALTERSRRPVTRALLLRACEIYQERFARPDGRVPATFEIVTLTGWAPDAGQPKPLRPGSATARLADALGTKEHDAGEKPG